MRDGGAIARTIVTSPCHGNFFNPLSAGHFKEKVRLNIKAKDEREAFMSEVKYRKSMQQNRRANNPRPGVDPCEWVPFDDKSTYFDEGVKWQTPQNDQYRRSMVALQAVTDILCRSIGKPEINLGEYSQRSEWVRRVYDGLSSSQQRSIFDVGRAIEKYNTNIAVGSSCVGQHEIWMQQSLSRDKHRNEWRQSGIYTAKIEHGNPGPGEVSEISAYNASARRATFRWMRKRKSTEKEGSTAARFTCTTSEIIDLRGYVEGDYKKLFESNDSRANFQKWIELLLCAEKHKRNM